MENLASVLDAGLSGARVPSHLEPHRTERLNRPVFLSAAKSWRLDDGVEAVPTVLRGNLTCSPSGTTVQH